MPGAATNGETSAVGDAGRDRGLLRLATAGSVDDGKSTLIGRLLYDAKAVLADQHRHLEEVSRRRGHDGLDLSLLTDGLRAEREQGITIDVAYRFFATERRSFILADTPGHEQYTRNMVTGASTADLAIVLVCARNGVLPQTRRHAFIASLLGVPHLVVAVNKMDLVDWDQGVFDHIVDEFTAFAAKLEVRDVTFIPISALHGDNVVERSPRAPWFDGSPLLPYLENVHIASDRNLVDARMPVQWVVREPRTGYRGYAGQVASGVMRRGDDVMVLPSGVQSRIAAIDTFDGEVVEAFPPLSVTIRLEDDVDVARGDVLCRPQNRPQVGRDLDAVVCWMGEAELRPGASYILRQPAGSVRCSVDSVLHRIDVVNLNRVLADSLELNDVGRVRLRTTRPIAFDPYARNRVTGSFILIDEATRDTVAAGMITGNAGYESNPSRISGRSTNVRWEDGEVTRTERRESLGRRGGVVWITGLPASGKSTLAAALEKRLIRDGAPAYRLDGDNLRHGLNGDLEFVPADRAENVRRTAHLARILADACNVALVSLVSPYEADRDLARSLCEDWQIDFLEVWVSTPLAECERRDPKGLYSSARRGEIDGMTGVTDPYEPPQAPDVIVDGSESVTASVERVIAALRLTGVLDDD